MRGLSRKQLASRRVRVRVRPGLLDATLVRLVRDMPAKHVWLSSNPVWVAWKFELRSEKFEISHFELHTSNFIRCGTSTAERLALEASV